MFFDDEGHESTRNGGLRRKFLEAFAGDPNRYPFQPVEDTYRRREDYYVTMQANVLAEAVCGFHSGAGNVLLHCRAVYDALSAYRPVDATGRRPQVEAELQLKDNIVELNGSLFWVTKCEEESGETAVKLKGFSLEGRSLETALQRHGVAEGRLKVRLFAGDYLVRYQCAASLQISAPKNLSLERMVLNPTRQDPGTYAMCRPLQPRLMPFNEDQERAVKSLSSRVELIHGPPGTGKSTTIFHVLSARMPAGAASVVTCVTNQAIDAVSEKLAITHEATNGMRILVLGNPSRVGKTAGRYTLANLCLRDSLVVSMKWALNLLQKVLKSVEALQQARQQRLWKAHRRSRLSLSYIENLPSVRRYKLDLQHDAMYGRRQPANFDPLQFYLDRLNSTKEKMARVVVRSKAMRVPSRQPPRLPWYGLWRRLWDVENFCQRLRRCVQRAQQALHVARDTAERRVVRQTRVFLCTIPSSYQVRKLQEDFPDDFPNRLAMSILDEAAATAETYVPLVISIGVENLVMLGDHKQLNPLVLATGGDREIKDKNVDRSFMERAMACQCPLHPLRIQYRMPEVLCQLVSQLFYGGQLRSDLSCQIGGLRLSGSALRWLQIHEMETEVGTSKINCAEVKHIVAALQSDSNFQNPREHVMIICLYKPQAALLEDTLRKFLAYRLDSGSIKVVTVDASQGSEAPHIILSTVRSNDSGSIGFASNPRRLCVGLSRAQKSLTVFGNATTFEQNRPHWQQVVDYFRRQRVLQRSALPIPAEVQDFVRTRAAEMVAARAPRDDRREVGGVRMGKGKGKGGGSSTIRCRYWVLGSCRYGLSCTFAHN